MTKYKAKKTQYNGINFDSKAEADFYKILLAEEANNKIKDIVIQPVFQLQESYVHNKKKIKAITYKADFMYTEIATNKTIVIDVKGMATEVANLKRKMFNYLFSSATMELIWVVKNKKYGNKYGYIEYDELKKIRQNNKKHKCKTA